MDLAELKFVVDTTQLKEAAKEVANLGTEVSKLNKPMQDLSNNTKKVSAATEKATKAAENKAKADTKVVDNSSKLDGLLDKLTNRYTDMAKGSTSAEASVLQLARTLGATSEAALKPYKDILESIRELSKSPFDSAIGSVRSITQEYDSMAHRAELASKGIFLTTNQLKEYSRIANEIKGKLKAADLDPTQGEGLAKFNSELKIQQDLYLGIANKVNTLKAAEKDRNDLLNAQMKESVRLQEASDNLFKYNLLRHKQDQDGYKQDMLEMRKYYSELEKQANRSVQSQTGQMDAAVDSYYKNQAKAADDAAKANAYLAKEMDRVNRLNAEGQSITSATNNRLIRFEQELRKSGLTAEQQASKLAIYRKELLATQKAAGNRQVDYLSRALGPQITDIFVGLYSGQSPMTVLVQQGGQLRDQFALAGVAGADMGKMLVQASKSMISSVKDVSVAVGQVLVGVFTGTGKAIANFGMELTNSNAIIDRMKALVIATAGVNSVFVRSLGFLGTALAGVSGGIVLAAIASIGALGVAYFKAAKEQDALTRQLVLTGGSLGLTTASAVDMAQSMNAVGVSTSAAISVITAMAKEGGFVAKEISVVTKAALEMEKYAGIAIEDTVKAFSKMKEKPVEALFELAKTTGMVSPEITKMVMELVSQGKSADATALAIKTLADVNAQQVARMKEDYTGLSLAMIEMGSSIKKFFDDTFKSLFFKVSPEQQLKDQIAAIDDILGGKAGVFGIGSLFADKEKYQTMREELTSQLNLIQRVNAASQERTAQQVKLNSDLEKFNRAEETFATNKQKREKEIAETTKRNQVLIAAGLITQQQHEKQIAAIREKYKDPKPDKSLDYFEGVLLSIEKLTNRNTVSQSELNVAQLKMLELIADPRFAKEPEKKQAEALQRLANASAVIDEVAALELLRKQNLKVTEEYVKQQSDKDKIWFDQMQMSDEATRAVKQETDDIIFQASIIGMTDKERNKAIATRKIELDLIKEKLRIESDKSLTPEQKLELLSEATDRAAQRTKNLDTAMQNAIGAEKMQMYGKAFEDVFKGMGDAMVDFALTGKTSFGDMVQSILVGLIKMQVQMQMMGMLQAMGGGKGIMSTLTSFITPSAKGNVFDGGIQAFAKGGTFTNGIVSSPTMFNMGLMGEAGPEAIMPLRRGSDGSLGVAASGGSAGNVSVQVINNSNAQATTNESVDSKGNRKIEVVIGDMTAGEISRSGSASQKSIRSTFGIQPQLIRR